MRQHELPFRRRQHGGVGQERDAGGRGEGVAKQEVAVTVHDGDLQPGVGGRAQRGDDLRVVRVIAVVVADPGLEEVAEDVEGLGFARAAREEAEEQRSRPGRPGRQVEVGDEEDQTISAFSMITSSTGTSWWKPLLPVRTARILSTTSRPSTTSPNTQ